MSLSILTVKKVKASCFCGFPQNICSRSLGGFTIYIHIYCGLLSDHVGRPICHMLVVTRIRETWVVPSEWSWVWMKQDSPPKSIYVLLTQLVGVCKVLREPFVSTLNLDVL